MLVPCVVSLLLVAALQLFLSRTFIGRAIMAVAQDQLALQLMAADPDPHQAHRVRHLDRDRGARRRALIIIQPVEPSVGREYIGRVFAICVLGGMGSLPGTVIAAMLLGIVESFTATFYGPSWAPAVAFGFLLLTLAFRPVRPSGTIGLHRDDPLFFLLIAIAVAAVVFFAGALVSNDYVFFAGYVVLQFIVLATAWNILGGYSGYVNFGSAPSSRSAPIPTVLLPQDLLRSADPGR